MKNKLAFIASISITIAIMLGAFGAHGLKAILSSGGLDAYKTAVMYQLLISIALFVLALTGKYQKPYKLAIKFIIIGMVLFSGSIYLLTIKQINASFDWLSFFGPVTPVGGLLMIIGWLLLSLKFFKNVEKSTN